MDVLVVDDDEEILLALCAFLRHDGHSVETARSFDEAKDSAGRQRPDAIVLFMTAEARPGTLARIEADGAFAEIPVFVIGDQRRTLGRSSIVVGPGELRDLFFGSSANRALN